MPAIKQPTHPRASAEPVMGGATTPQTGQKTATPDISNSGRKNAQIRTGKESLVNLLLRAQSPKFLILGIVIAAWEAADKEVSQEFLRILPSLHLQEGLPVIDTRNLDWVK